MESQFIKQGSLVSILFSLLLIPVWGLGLLALDTSSIYSVFFVVIFSCVGEYEILRRIKPKKDYLILIGPLFYLVMILVVHFFVETQEELYKHPIIWASIIYLITFSLFKMNKRRVYLRLLVVSALYAFAIYPNSPSYHEWDEEEEIVSDSLNKIANLEKFEFLESENESIKLISEKYILLETWNESCPPCIKSIKSLQDTLSKINGITNYYLYQQRGKQKLSQEEIFNFDLIDERIKILIDPNNTLYDSLNLKAYPYFLLFDREGNLVGNRRGYSKEIKNDILDWLHKKTVKASS